MMRPSYITAMRSASREYLVEVLTDHEGDHALLTLSDELWVDVFRSPDVDAAGGLSCDHHRRL